MYNSGIFKYMSLLNSSAAPRIIWSIGAVSAIILIGKKVYEKVTEMRFEKKMQLKEKQRISNLRTKREL